MLCSASDAEVHHSGLLGHQKADFDGRLPTGGSRAMGNAVGGVFDGFHRQVLDFQYVSIFHPLTTDFLL